MGLPRIHCAPVLMNATTVQKNPSVARTRVVGRWHSLWTPQRVLYSLASTTVGCPRRPPDHIEERPHQWLMYIRLSPRFDASFLTRIRTGAHHASRGGPSTAGCPPIVLKRGRAS